LTGGDIDLGYSPCKFFLSSAGKSCVIIAVGRESHASASGESLGREERRLSKTSARESSTPTQPHECTIRRSPESMGLAPDGDDHAALPAEDKKNLPRRITEVDVTASQAIRSFAFWALVFGAAVRNASYHAISTHFIPMMIGKE